MDKKCVAVLDIYRENLTISSEHYNNFDRMRTISGHYGEFIQDRYFNPLIGTAFPKGPASFFNNFINELSLCSENAFPAADRGPFTPEAEISPSGAAVDE